MEIKTNIQIFLINQEKRTQSILFFILLIFILNNLGLEAQNYGLLQKQPVSTLPKSNAAVKFPVAKLKVAPNTKLISVSSNEWIISNGWELLEAGLINTDEKNISTTSYNSNAWYNAIVPGTVLTSLIDQGVYPDPYYGLNNLVIPDTLCRQQWWYRTALKIPAAFKGKNIQLLFNGINYKADIWLNSKKIARMEGAFVRGIFDITKELNYSGDNIVAVHIYPPIHPGIPHEASSTAERGPNGGVLCYDGPTFISSEGWDWVPGIRDRNIGIWQDVRLLVNAGVSIVDPQIICDLPLPDTSKAKITINTTLKNGAESTIITLAGQIENIRFSQKVILAANESKTVTISPEMFQQLNIQNPRLWWPNGYGNPELYKLNLAVLNENGDTIDKKNIGFGIREMSYDLTIDYPKRQYVRVEYNPIFALKNKLPILNNKYARDIGEDIKIPKLKNSADSVLLKIGENKDCAPYMVIKVNGKRIMCKGGNWGMDDGLKRCTRERLEPYVRLHKEAGYTMLRNWTGESTEDLLYELCNEYGILVFNEFWMSTERYNLEPWDNQLFVNNARDVIKRFRNHPSIALWCARNEGSAANVLEDSLSYLVASDDGTRYYLTSSTLINLRQSGPWDYYTDQNFYFNERGIGFNTELGSPSVPTAETMRAMMDVKDVWPIGDVWYYHDYHNGQPDYTKAIENQFGKPVSLDDFCKKAQMINYESYRNLFETYNNNLFKSACGVLLWMSHPAWPSTVWQTYSSDYETHGSYFGAKKACEPVHIQMNPHDNKVLVANTSLKNIAGAKASLKILNLNAIELFNKEVFIDIPANDKVDCFIPSLPANLPDVYFALVTLVGEKGELISENFYWRSSAKDKNFTAFNQLPEVKLEGSIIKQAKGTMNLATFTINNPSKYMALTIKLNLRDAANGERILPAYFSDGYFTLLPWQSKQISVKYPQQFGNKKLLITTDGYNIKSSTIITLK